MRSTLGKALWGWPWPAEFGAPQLRRLWAVGLGIHIIAAVFTLGYHQADEHFQILEFLEFKRQGFPASDLAWEYEARIRPWLQPALYLPLVNLMHGVGLTHPFVQVAVLRGVSSLVGFATLVLFARAVWYQMPSWNYRRWLVICLSLGWCFPYFHARTSSENLSASAFLLGLSWLLLQGQQAHPDHETPPSPSPVPLLAAGLALGLGFAFRYQTGLMVAGVFGWLAWTRKWRTAVLLGVGVAVAVGVGALADRWGYGTWVFPPWDYLRINVLEGRASQYGEDPWWYYLRKVATESPVPVGFFLVVGMLAFWWRRPGHVFTWATVPFFVVHSLIAHKELRFLWPMVAVAFVQMLLGLEGAWEQGRGWLRRGRHDWGRRLVRLGWVVNAVYLVVLAVKPLQSDVVFLREVYARYPQSLEVYRFDRHDPFQFTGKPFHFYTPQDITLHLLSGSEAFYQQLGSRDAPMVVYLHDNWIPDDKAFLRESCRVVYRTFPPWFDRINIGDWMRRVFKGMLLECSPSAAQVRLD